MQQEQGNQQKRKKRLRGMVNFSFFLAAIVTIYSLVAGLATEGIFYNPFDAPSAVTTEEKEQNQNTGSDASSLQNADAPWNLILVNKWKPVPDNYKVNLVSVPGGEQVDERIYEPLMELLEAAKEANWNQPPKVVSGYRTAKKQQSLYDEKIKTYQREGYSASKAKELAERWVAVPGYGEHQLGLAVDINGATYDLYLWLQENSYKYGFIFRYPGEKTQITGIAEEVWHYRYVGIEAATQMYEQGLCLEEYREKLKG